jgi:hypothetical protein
MKLLGERGDHGETKGDLFNGRHLRAAKMSVTEQI